MSQLIPFVNLFAQYLTIKSEIDDAISNVINESAFVRGPYVDKFESDFASVLGMQNCISCANGTDALYIAMKALDINDGDEVIVPAHSWISTSETVTQAGGKVVFCDTDPITFTIDPRQIESKITSKTVGIIPVHLYGQPADMDSIMALANKYKLWVIEDCAQAHLAKYKNQIVGTFGNIATFSFYPGKNLGAMGDAGAIVTNNLRLAERMTMFARHGGFKKGDHTIEGVNSRLDGLQAAILSVKLKYLPQWTLRRQEIAKLYTKELSNIKNVTLPSIANGRSHVWHLYVIQHKNRDSLARYLSKQNIQTAINYPIALPFLPAYQRFGHRKEDFPVAYKHQSTILSIPIFPEITYEQINRVSESIRLFNLTDN
jgi:dTDP-4-amino-4,6-dideoxygalactose transaminase